MKKRVYLVISPVEGIKVMTECLDIAMSYAGRLAKGSIYPITIESHNNKFTKEYPKERMIFSGVSNPIWS